ncbi:MAG: sulfate permease [Acidimicrobiia bacterium]|nr:sulfate permease [Acidimicrobiia bacterium]
MRRWISVLDWLPHYRRADLPGDLMAGLTGAAVLVPQSMAYAQIAHLPPVVGLYASVVPLLVYAVLGRVPQLGVGPLASISILSAVGVAKLAPANTGQFVTLSATLAIVAGLVHLAIGLARLGFLIRFLSEPVMTGFLAGLGVLLIATQLGALTGTHIAATSAKAYDVFRDWVNGVDAASLTTTALGVVSLAILLVARRWRRFPAALALIVVTSIAAVVLGLDQHGVAVVGKVPSGLALPKNPISSVHDLTVLLPTAFAITLISILEAMTLAQNFADEHGYEIDPNQEIAALGASNVAAGFFQGLVVTSAITRSTILDEAGARTQLSGVVSAVIVAVLVMFGTGLFRYIPICVLGAIVIVAVLPFIKIGEARRVWRVQRADFWVMMLAFVGTLVLGLELGVVLAVATSITLIVYRICRPRIPELGRLPHTDAFVELARHPDAETFPGTAIVRVEAALYFSNADVVADRLRRLPSDRPGLRTIVLDCSGVNHLDTTADHKLRKLVSRLHEQGVTLFLVNVDGGVRAVMDASGLADEVGKDHFFASDADALAHLGSQVAAD